VYGLVHAAQDRDQRQAVVNDNSGVIKGGEIIGCLSDYYFLIKDYGPWRCDSPASRVSAVLLCGTSS
jgi:hypothetical protein